jgi:hypothetical protein
MNLRIQHKRARLRHKKSSELMNRITPFPGCTGHRKYAYEEQATLFLGRVYTAACL